MAHVPTQAELLWLLVEPNESLTLEYKSWLDLSASPGKATFAKAAIALANEGGGIIIFGMRSNEGAPLASQVMPMGMARYDQDAVNAAANRFADPQIHCELAFAHHPETQVEHAFVIVPGGVTVPVMSKRDHQGEIMAQRCYVRKPGPRSEEPFTAEEWRGVLERCLRARREDMLNAIRLIVQGQPLPPPPAEHAALNAFCARADARWLALIDPLPENDPARMPLGYYSTSFELMGVEPAPNFIELRRRMNEARRIKHSGWGPFILLTREDLAPNVVDDAMEAWLGDPMPERGLERTPDHCDFWRSSRSGLLHLQRGYDEDGWPQVEHGAHFSITTPIWRIGETLLFVSRLARLFGENPEVFIRIRYSGLRGRELAYFGPFGVRREGKKSTDDNVMLEAQSLASQLDDNVVEVTHSLLSPLYERFGFLELPLELVAQELETMRRHRF